MQWTPDLDERLLKAPVPVQEVIDRLEANEASGLTPAGLGAAGRLREKLEKQNEVIPLMVSFLRAERAKVATLMLITQDDWKHLRAHFLLELLEYNELEQETRNRAVHTLQEELKDEKVLQFVLALPVDRRDAFLADLDALDADAKVEADQMVQAVEAEHDGLFGEATWEVLQFLRNRGDEQAHELGYGAPEPSFVLDLNHQIHIRDRLEDLLANT